MRTGAVRGARGARARLAAAIPLSLGLAACSWFRPPPPAPPELPPPPPAPAPAPPPPCARIERIEVRKAERALVAECAGGGRLEFPIALSREPGPKRRRGDQRTPEGEYRIAGRARPSRFHRFLPIDYPSDSDAQRALAEGLISASEREAIASAHRQGRLPPQNTALGGWLGFHGEGRRWRGDLDLDWTEGCFALEDAAIDQLVELAPSGTPVRILP
jgi:hypothetical protein